MSNRPLTKAEWLTSLEELWEAAQQPRPWVGLTDEEIMRTYADTKSVAGFYNAERFARGIEAKLKEKNT
jgi:hypothetical protein